MPLHAVIHSGEFYAALCALLWAIAIILFRKGGEQVPPVALNLFKNTVAMVLILPTMALLGAEYVPKESPLEDWLLLLASGVIGIGVADSVFFASLNRLGAGRAAIVDCLYSPFVILCSFVYLREPVRPTLIPAVALMVTAILVGTWLPQHAVGAEDRSQTRRGILLGVVSMVFMAAGIVMAKPVLDRSNPLWACAVRLAGGAVPLALLAVTKAHRGSVVRCFLPGPLWRVTLPAGIVGAYLATIFWIMGMKYAYTNIASVLNQLSTIFVLMLASVFLREQLTLRKTIAILAGFAGGVLVTM